MSSVDSWSYCTAANTQHTKVNALCMNCTINVVCCYAMIYLYLISFLSVWLEMYFGRPFFGVKKRSNRVNSATWTTAPAVMSSHRTIINPHHIDRWSSHKSLVCEQKWAGGQPSKKHDVAAGKKWDFWLWIELQKHKPITNADVEAHIDIRASIDGICVQRVGR